MVMEEFQVSYLIEKMTNWHWNWDEEFHSFVR
jgi:hypothetical protein